MGRGDKQGLLALPLTFTNSRDTEGTRRINKMVEEEPYSTITIMFCQMSFEVQSPRTLTSANGDTWQNSDR